ncbi:phage portal protein family protein [Verrucomicrobium spinosum]|uniref:phage portal protein family protein n=1 Tax=Verrucomicrobium spinosum TaxID=2736 RepID=UPI003CCE4025
MSKKDGVGASLQGDETDILEQDDCKLISSHLQVHLVRKVIAMTFGSQVEPLVYIEIQPTPNQDIKLEMEVDNHFEKLGIPQSKAAIAERYGRPLPEAGEDLVGEAGKAQAATRAAESATASSPATSLANEATAEDEALREAVVADLAPIYEAIAKVLDEEDEDEDDDEVSFGRLRELNGNWAEITDAVLAGEAVEAAMTRILGEAFVGGLNLERIARDSLAAANANPYHDSSTGRFMRGPTKTGQPHQKTPASLRTSISEVLQSAMDEPDSRDYVEYSQIDDIEAAKLKALPGAPADLPIEAGWKRVVTAGEARHIIGKHWKDPRPVRPSDFDKLPELLAKPKAQKWITRHGVKPPILETTIDDKGELYVVEELRTGRKTLSLLSMFRK